MRILARPLAALVLFLAAGVLRGEAPKSFFFKEGDRIVFLGDSITEQYQYSTEMELYLTTRFPKWNLTFINAGIGGHTANGGAGRFQAHVLAEKPTAVTIDFGMNDGGYGAFDANRNKVYVEKTQAMLEMAKKAGVRVALISPNAVDWRNRPQFKTYLETQKKFYAPLRELAEKYSVPFVDQYAVTRATLEKIENEDKIRGHAVSPFPDGVHTSWSGGLLMAHTILVGLNAPSLVSEVSVDAASGKATTKGCTVDKLAATGRSVSFDRTDDVLPMPVQKECVAILPYVNQLKDLNWYGLKVAGLATAKYTLL